MEYPRPRAILLQRRLAFHRPGREPDNAAQPSLPTDFRVSDPYELTQEREGPLHTWLAGGGAGTSGKRAPPAAALIAHRR